MIEQRDPPASMPRPEGLILCGGAGRRVGGRDKGLLRIGDEATVVLASRLLAPLCSRIMISANRNRAAYAGLNLGPVIADGRNGYAGPLAGLEAALALLASDRLLVLPCDLPDLPPAVPRTLLATLDDSAHDAVYACAGGHAHYLVAALRRRALTGVTATLDRGEHAVRRWLAAIDAAAVDFDGIPGDAFRNRNRTADWAEK